MHLTVSSENHLKNRRLFPLYGQFWKDLLVSCNTSVVFIEELYFNSITSIEGHREGETQKKSDTYIFFNVVLSIFSTVRGLASLTERNVMIIS